MNCTPYGIMPGGSVPQAACQKCNQGISVLPKPPAAASAQRYYDDYIYFDSKKSLNQVLKEMCHLRQNSRMLLEK